MQVLKLTRIGDALGVVLPPEILNQLELKEGDAIYLDKSGDTTVLGKAETGYLSADPATVEQLRAGHEFMRDYHAAFRALAK